MRSRRSSTRSGGEPANDHEARLSDRRRQYESSRSSPNDCLRKRFLTRSQLSREVPTPEWESSIDPLGPAADPLPGGINPTAVNVLTPVFIRGSRTGRASAGLLNRLLSEEPLAWDLAGYSEDLALADIAVQKAYVSTYPHFVPAYADPWLKDSLDPVVTAERLKQFPSQEATDGVTTHFRAGPIRPLLVAPLDAVAGTGELTAATTVAGHHAVAIPSEEFEAGQLRVLPSLLVSNGIDPSVGLGPREVRDGAILAAGDFATGIDFHTAWADNFVSASWWRSPRLLQANGVALTESGLPQVLTIPLSSGRRHVFLQYFLSYAGARLSVALEGHSRELATRDDSFGHFRWLDAGITRGGPGVQLRITSRSGLNAIGQVLALGTDDEGDVERRRLALAELPQVTVLKDFAGVEARRIAIGGKRPSRVYYSALGNDFPLELEVRLRRHQGRCQLQLASAVSSAYGLRIDGRQPESSSPVTLAPFH
jgi:hypothetical protein